MREEDITTKIELKSMPNIYEGVYEAMTFSNNFRDFLKEELKRRSWQNF